MAVLVTGGAGYIGSAFVELLRTAGEQARSARGEVLRQVLDVEGGVHWAGSTRWQATK